MLSVRCLSACLSVLSVTLVHCGQTVGQIKMKLGMRVGSALVTLYQMGPIQHNVACAEVPRTKWHLDQSSLLATIAMGRKVLGLCPFYSGS